MAMANSPEFPDNGPYESTIDSEVQVSQTKKEAPWRKRLNSFNDGFRPDWERAIARLKIVAIAHSEIHVGKTPEETQKARIAAAVDLLDEVEKSVEAKDPKGISGLAGTMVGAAATIFPKAWDKFRDIARDDQGLYIDAHAARLDMDTFPGRSSLIFADSFDGALTFGGLAVPFVKQGAQPFLTPGFRLFQEGTEAAVTGLFDGLGGVAEEYKSTGQMSPRDVAIQLGSSTLWGVASPFSSVELGPIGRLGPEQLIEPYFTQESGLLDPASQDPGWFASTLREQYIKDNSMGYPIFKEPLK